MSSAYVPANPATTLCRTKNNVHTYSFLIRRGRLHPNPGAGGFFFVCPAPRAACGKTARRPRGFFAAKYGALCTVAPCPRPDSFLIPPPAELLGDRARPCPLSRVRCFWIGGAEGCRGAPLLSKTSRKAGANGSAAPPVFPFGRPLRPFSSPQRRKIEIFLIYTIKNGEKIKRTGLLDERCCKVYNNGVNKNWLRVNKKGSTQNWLMGETICYSETENSETRPAARSQA